MGDDFKYYLMLLLGAVFAVFLITQNYENYPTLNKGVIVNASCGEGEIGVAVRTNLNDANKKASIPINKEGVACILSTNESLNVIGLEVFWIISEEGNLKLIGPVDSTLLEDSI